MIKTALLVTSFIAVAIAPLAAQVKNYIPVTPQMLLNPSPDDWLMYSRTYDAQRYSPLKEINRANVAQLRMAWTRGLGPGTILHPMKDEPPSPSASRMPMPGALCTVTLRRVMASHSSIEIACGAPASCPALKDARSPGRAKWPIPSR